MLFPYTYVPHKMENMQAFIDFIFYEVWCKAPVGLVFHPDLFDANTELKELMVNFGFSTQAAERGKSFYKDVKAIYNLFAPLSSQEVDQFKKWYQGNNDIEKVCANEPVIQLLRYKDAITSHPALGKQLALFFRGLYDSSLLNLSAIKEKIGTIKDHNKKFFEANKAGKCPFCGISDLKGVHHTRREAYDHYLPKYRYPFNSINFRNLAPACNECNSTYKLSKDPVHNSIGRRKAFNPFSTSSYTIQLQVNLQHADIDNLKEKDIELKFGPAVLSEEIDTWKDVYGIEERYKAKLFGENDGKAWLEQVFIECQGYNKKPKEILAMRVKQAQAQPYADCNFLRSPFLQACQNLGLFSGTGQP